MEKKVVLNLKFKDNEKKHLIIDGKEYLVNKCFQTMNGIQLQSNHLYETFGVKGKEIFNNCVIKNVTESKTKNIDGDDVKCLSLLISFKSISK